MHMCRPPSMSPSTCCTGCPRKGTRRAACVSGDPDDVHPIDEPDAMHILCTYLSASTNRSARVQQQRCIACTKRMRTAVCTPYRTMPHIPPHTKSLCALFLNMPGSFQHRSKSSRPSNQCVSPHASTPPCATSQAWPACPWAACTRA